jgi:8-oxo-dGTP pyrophosphatase MutT (NUDIX family)
MTRLYGENAAKECAYLPQMQALVNRESRSATRARAPRARLELPSAFRARARLLRTPGSCEPPARLLRTDAAEGYGWRMQLTSLREQLGRYCPADETEARFVTRMAVLALKIEACSRSHYTPGHFTASAFVLSPDRSELILIHHKKLGIWVQPGGHVEGTDLELESAARREVAEEVGLRNLQPLLASGVLFDVDIHAIPARKAEPQHEHFDVRFAFVAETRDFELSEEVIDVRWLPLADVSRTTTDRSVLRAVDKLRRLLA